MTQDIAMMKYGQSELPRLSQKEEAALGTRTSSQFGGRLPEARRLQQRVEKTVWLSQALILRSNHLLSKAIARRETQPEKLRRSGW